MAAIDLKRHGQMFEGFVASITVSAQSIFKNLKTFGAKAVICFGWKCSGQLKAGGPSGTKIAS
jgi:hypothetical protein